MERDEDNLGMNTEISRAATLQIIRGMEPIMAVCMDAIPEKSYKRYVVNGLRTVINRDLNQTDILLSTDQIRLFNGGPTKLHVFAHDKTITKTDSTLPYRLYTNFVTNRLVHEKLQTLEDEDVINAHIDTIYRLYPNGKSKKQILFNQDIIPLELFEGDHEFLSKHETTIDNVKNPFVTIEVTLSPEDFEFLSASNQIIQARLDEILKKQ